jgi:superfamily II DNA or RNA helicase
MTDDLESLRKKYQNALAEIDKLRQENARLKQSAIPPISTSVIKPKVKVHQPASATSKIHSQSSAEEKIALFRQLFRGREDVYPKRWESKNNNSGYSPVCSNEWNPAYCDKPRVKCNKCQNRQYVSLTDKVIYDHLAGKQTIGVYPLLPGDLCWFLAVDFDGTEWVDDVSAFLETCHVLQVPATLERSRSGNGGHVWIFFSEPIQSSLARQLGSAILTKTMEKRHQIGLKSYDRLFPSQDTMPKGGFGNLIALPLQKAPREKGNSVFLDSDFQPFSDQWTYLFSIEKLTPNQTEKLVAEAIRDRSILCIKASTLDEENVEDPWTLPPSGVKKQHIVNYPLPGEVSIVLGDLIYFDKEELPAGLQNQLVQLAAFQNPEFYKAQAMRRSTYKLSRILFCSEEFPKHIALPRGCLPDVENLFNNLGIEIRLKDERFKGKPLRVGFKGKLRVQQKISVKELRKHDIGVLSAATAFGKTVIAAKLIAVRKRNTLILVHRKQLMDQWREKLSVFLGIDPKEIGQFSGTKKQITGKLDVAVIQSLCRKGMVDDIVADYGHVIVDECHHVAALSFEQLMKKVKAHYVLGLTATPVRKDGHHPIIIMQCGPIRYRYNGKEATADSSFKHVVRVRPTGFQYTPENDQPALYKIYQNLLVDETRNGQICKDILESLKSNRSPLLLTERTEHLHIISDLLADKVKNIVILKGGMSKKQKDNVDEQLKNIGKDEERIILATGRYIGEGFDDARLDTLFLALPISWKGTIQQYAGRLHRQYDGKEEVRIYDYLDESVPMLSRMYKKRLLGYKSIGYEIIEPETSTT